MKSDQRRVWTEGIAPKITQTLILTGTMYTYANLFRFIEKSLAQMENPEPNIVSVEND